MQHLLTNPDFCTGLRELWLRGRPDPGGKWRCDDRDRVRPQRKKGQRVWQADGRAGRPDARGSLRGHAPALPAGRNPAWRPRPVLRWLGVRKPQAIRLPLQPAWTFPLTVDTTRLAVCGSFGRSAQTTHSGHCAADMGGGKDLPGLAGDRRRQLRLVRRASLIPPIVGSNRPRQARAWRFSHSRVRGC
ncbi:hypothetical protein CLV78_101999 [Aliiruegeria haliotis]|uniref:Uncharacterized protein n=1 Tax=Aliiruegeria haliotis TaxID=1280846 RepID=A0A2T0S0F5_9RHOB|nr:hypothetical protein CLV78_101999 [Aliiruegeria haliotis]